ncbi:MAG: tetratricopeptide repeat protein, partial [Bacteroidales bacterium]|nr:tetratricopeptide repeat protein [Bacteroidales bacterium]
IMLLERALVVDNTNKDVLIELAYAYEMSDNIDKAIDITNKIIDLNPYSFDAWVSLGRLYLYNFEYELSIEAYDFALAIKESDVDVLKLKAVTYNEGYEYEKELEVLNECIDASPEDESLYEEILEKYKQFEEYWGLEQDEGILKVLEKKEATFGPKGLLLKMAHLNLRNDKTEKAQELFDRVPEEEKNTVDYYRIQGDLALHNDDEVGAEAAYMMALKESPNDVDVLDRLAEISSELDKQEQSAEFLEQLIAIDPDYGIAKFRLAIIRFEFGEKEPFDEIINQISDKQQLVILLSMFSPFRGKEKIDYDQFSREELLVRLDEARENRVELKRKHI